jgi:trimeric autotransporter adhesin
MFDVEGARSSYEPGDVLVISEDTDRTVEKSSEANSTKVAGVFATKPGVVLTEKGIDERLDDLVPMGVVGVIPTKVCLENGAIKRGDLLVTSSKAGHAMKATAIIINGMTIYPTGAILGKALENFDGAETGLIKVLVNVK